MAASEKDMASGSVTARLIDLISRLPVNAQEVLLKKLEEKTGIYKRKHPRKPYVSEVDFSAGDQAYKELIQDISPSGLFIETRAPLAVGQEITLLLSFPDQERPMKILGEVVRATDEGIGPLASRSTPIASTET
ncbi:MAG: PilZ domain-containing protein [Deltaproteobacteria bacterium]|nr:PilZ domain-containing protein [Deltaproteobacteria bacterium]